MPLSPREASKTQRADPLARRGIERSIFDPLLTRDGASQEPVLAATLRKTLKVSAVVLGLVTPQLAQRRVTTAALHMPNGSHLAQGVLPHAGAAENHLTDSRIDRIFR